MAAPALPPGAVLQAAPGLGIPPLWGVAAPLGPPNQNLFIVHDDTAEPGDPHYGRAARYAEIELGEPPTDDYEDDEHFSIGWLTESDEEHPEGEERLDPNDY